MAKGAGLQPLAHLEGAVAHKLLIEHLFLLPLLPPTILLGRPRAVHGRCRCLHTAGAGRQGCDAGRQVAGGGGVKTVSRLRCRRRLQS